MYRGIGRGIGGLREWNREERKGKKSYKLAGRENGWMNDETEEKSPK